MQYSKSQVKKLNENFDRILLEVIEDSFAKIGGSMGPVIYYYLERNFIPKKEIPKKTKQFSSCLKQIFGERTEYFIKMIIVKNLYIEIEESLEEIKNWSFTDYVKAVSYTHLTLPTKRIV